MDSLGTNNMMAQATYRAQGGGSESGTKDSARIRPFPVTRKHRCIYIGGGNGEIKRQFFPTGLPIGKIFPLFFLEHTNKEGRGRQARGSRLQESSPRTADYWAVRSVFRHPGARVLHPDIPPIYIYYVYMYIYIHLYIDDLVPTRWEGSMFSRSCRFALDEIDQWCKAGV